MPESRFVLHHPLVRLARIAVETYVREQRILPVPYPLPPEQHETAGVFVSLVSNAALRGSVGTLRPTQPTLAAEVILNAVAAAVRDPRFTPVKPLELTDISYTIDVVRRLEPLASLDGHDPQTSGLAVRCGRRWGAALPALEGIESALAQRDTALRKAQIDPAEPYTLLCFSVDRLS